MKKRKRYDLFLTASLFLSFTKMRSNGADHSLLGGTVPGGLYRSFVQPNLFTRYQHGIWCETRGPLVATLRMMLFRHHIENVREKRRGKVTGFPVKRGALPQQRPGGGCNRITGSQPEQQDWLLVVDRSTRTVFQGTDFATKEPCFFVICISRKLLTVSPIRYLLTRLLLLPEQQKTQCMKLGHKINRRLQFWNCPGGLSAV